jgi:hypothetical protein
LLLLLLGLGVLLLVEVALLLLVPPLEVTLVLLVLCGWLACRGGRGVEWAEEVAERGGGVEIGGVLRGWGLVGENYWRRSCGLRGST